MIKELTPQEVARRLADEGCFEGMVRNYSCEKWANRIITGIDFDSQLPIRCKYLEYYRHCAIKIPDEYIPYPDDECPPLKCGDVLISKCDKTENIIVSIDKRKDEKGHVFIQSSWKYNKELFDLYTYLDGSPIGKKVE